MIFKSDRLNAYSIFLILSGTSAFALSVISIINSVYLVETVRLDPLQLVLVGTVLESSAFLCQVPTGVIADLYSRRFAVVIGYLLMGAGFLLEGIVPQFAAVLLSQVIWGVGATFTDGAQEAWIAEEMGEEHVSRVFLRASQIGLIATLVSIPLSVVLGSVRLNLAILAGAGVFLALGLFLLLFMPEHHFRHQQETTAKVASTWKALAGQMRDSAKAIKSSPMLLIILCITVCSGMASEGFDRLQAAHFIQDFTFPSLGHLNSVTWFGIMSLVGTLLVLAATELVRRCVDINNMRALVSTQFILNVLLLVSVVLFGLVGNFFLALALFWAATVCRKAALPLYITWLTRSSDPRMRATVISISGQADAIGQIAGGPIVGLIGNLVSLRAAIVTTGAILAPNVFFFARAMRHSKIAPATGLENVPEEVLQE
jgi:DHA3 family tetracycline resistance protein-like MFS transporter